MDNLAELNISQSDIEASPILKTMYGGSDKTTVFLPNYGDFGPVIHKLIKLVHFFKCPKKIVCCRKGEEAFYPTADEFYYDWDSFVEEKYRWGFFSQIKIGGVGRNYNYNEYKRKCGEDYENIKAYYGENINYIHLWEFSVDYVFEKYDNLFRFKLLPRKVQNIKVDVIVSPRYRKSREINNFMHWEEIIEILNSHRYRVGCVGSREESFELSNSSVNSWEHTDPASASIEMLSNCKIYIGLDTGVSHLAGFMSVPMILFSHANPKRYSSNYIKRMTEGYFLDLGRNVTDYSKITSSALEYLKKQEEESNV